MKPCGQPKYDASGELVGCDRQIEDDQMGCVDHPFAESLSPKSLANNARYLARNEEKTIRLRVLRAMHAIGMGEKVAGQPPTRIEAFAVKECADALIRLRLEAIGMMVGVIPAGSAMADRHARAVKNLKSIGLLEWARACAEWRSRLTVTKWEKEYPAR